MTCPFVPLIGSLSAFAMPNLIPVDRKPLAPSQKNNGAITIRPIWTIGVPFLKPPNASLSSRRTRAGRCSTRLPRDRDWMTRQRQEANGAAARPGGQHPPGRSRWVGLASNAERPFRGTAPEREYRLELDGAFLDPGNRQSKQPLEQWAEDFLVEEAVSRRGN